MTGQRELKAIICDFDPWGLKALGAEITDAGFELLAESSSGIDALRQVDLLQPTLVVIAHELEGMSGFETLTDIRRREDPPEVILISTDDSIRERAVEAGAFEVVVKGESEMFARILDEVKELLETGERRKSRDRRDGTDRRQHQDWSQVTAERRSGKDRRGGLRREKDVTSKARETLVQQRAAEHPPS